MGELTAVEESKSLMHGHLEECGGRIETTMTQGMKAVGVYEELLKEGGGTIIFCPAIGEADHEQSPACFCINGIELTHPNADLELKVLLKERARAKLVTVRIEAEKEAAEKAERKLDAKIEAAQRLALRAPPTPR